MPDRVQAASPDVIWVSSRGELESGMETTVTPNPEIRGGIGGLEARVCFEGTVVCRVAGGRVLVSRWSATRGTAEGEGHSQTVLE